MSSNELENELEIDELTMPTEEEWELIGTFFTIYEARFAYTPHMPDDLFLKANGNPQDLSIDQKGHLFTCKDCCAKFFSQEISLDLFVASMPESQSVIPIEALTQKDGDDITRPSIEARREDKLFATFIDGKEYRTEKSELTGTEIMDLGGVSREAGLIMILENGTQVQVGKDEVIELKPSRKFKRAPRFSRG
ncbi:MAG: multiubiquitin domain-containing protein [Nitrospirae bacterium]|nr:multiubiquitin domain-containing protein [Nitrospirota bacterium]